MKHQTTVFSGPSEPLAAAIATIQQAWHNKRDAVVDDLPERTQAAWNAAVANLLRNLNGLGWPCLADVTDFVAGWDADDEPRSLMYFRRAMEALPQAGDAEVDAMVTCLQSKTVQFADRPEQLASLRRFAAGVAEASRLPWLAPEEEVFAEDES